MADAEPTLAPVAARTELRHVAAVMTPEANVVARDVQRLQQLRRDEGARNMFTAEATQPAETYLVDFDQMQDVIDTVDTNTNAGQAEEARLIALRDVYRDLNTEGNVAGNASVAEVRQAMAAMPGLAESIAYNLSTRGAAVSADTVRQYLENPQNAGLAAGNANNINAMIQRYTNDARFRTALRRHLSNLELSQDVAANDQEIAQLTARTSQQREQQLGNERTTLQQTIQNYEQLTPAQRQSISQAARQVNASIQAIPAEYQPIDTTHQSIQTQLGIVQQDITDRQAIVGNNLLTPQARTAAQNELTRLQSVQTRLNNAQSILNNFGQQIDLYERAQAAPQRITEIDNELGQIGQDRIRLRRLQGTRNRERERYKATMRGAMDAASRDYWSQLIAEGGSLAQTEAQAETTRTTENKTEQEQREAVVKKIFDRFAVISYMNYRGGRVTGFNDGEIRTFARNALLQGPEATARAMLARIESQSANLPPDIRAELREMQAELRKVGGRSQISAETWRKMGKEMMPKMMGLAYSREGLNIFNRVRFSKAEATAIAQNYGTDFWEKALTNKGEFQSQADALFGKGIINLRGNVHESLVKGFAGKSAGEFFKKLLIFLAIIAVIGVGAGALAGRTI